MEPVVEPALGFIRIGFTVLSWTSMPMGRRPELDENEGVFVLLFLLRIGDQRLAFDFEAGAVHLKCRIASGVAHLNAYGDHVVAVGQGLGDGRNLTLSRR